MVLRSWKTDSELSEKQRTTTFHPLEMYTFRNYLAYTLYAPLYIAGPIVTFNDFLWQVRIIKLLAVASCTSITPAFSSFALLISQRATHCDMPHGLFSHYLPWSLSCTSCTSLP